MRPMYTTPWSSSVEIFFSHSYFETIILKNLKNLKDREDIISSQDDFLQLGTFPSLTMKRCSNKEQLFTS